MKLQPQKKKRGEGITHVSKLFEKYAKTLQAPQGVVVNEFVELIHDLFNITIKPEHCSYTVSTKTLTLAVSGILKSEILKQKREIIMHLRGRLGEKSAPKDIF